MLRHPTLIKDFVPFIPKHHLWCHLVAECQALGNPRFYQTFLDESLNSTLKGCCRGAHQAVFERTVLRRMHEVLAALQKKMRR